MSGGFHPIAPAGLAAAGLLVAAGALARPHQPPPPWEDPAGPPTEGDVWLKRLVGSYDVDGMVNVVAKGGCGEEGAYCETVRGKGDCIGIGSGPGVQCILQLAWPDMYEIVFPPEEDAGTYNLPGGVSNLGPAMALFGLDPGKSAVHYMLVDQKGLSEGGLGLNTGSRMTFRSPCVNWPTLLNAMRPISPMPHSCERIMRIEARAEGRVVFLSMDIEIDDEPFTRYEMTLRRDSPAPSSAPEAAAMPVPARTRAPMSPPMPSSMPLPQRR